MLNAIFNKEKQSEEAGFQTTTAAGSRSAQLNGLLTARHPNAAFLQQTGCAATEQRGHPRAHTGQIRSTSVVGIRRARQQRGRAAGIEQEPRCRSRAELQELRPAAPPRPFGTLRPRRIPQSQAQPRPTEPHRRPPRAGRARPQPARSPSSEPPDGPERLRGASPSPPAARGPPSPAHDPPFCSIHAPLPPPPPGPARARLRPPHPFLSHQRRRLTAHARRALPPFRACAVPAHTFDHAHSI